MWDQQLCRIKSSDSAILWIAQIWEWEGFVHSAELEKGISISRANSSHQIFSMWTGHWNQMLPAIFPFLLAICLVLFLLCFFNLSFNPFTSSLPLLFSFLITSSSPLIHLGVNRSNIHVNEGRMWPQTYKYSYFILTKWPSSNTKLLSCSKVHNMAEPCWEKWSFAFSSICYLDAPEFGPLVLQSK